MLATASKPGVAASPAGRWPPLENGESLRSREFLRRYEGMSRIKKAELIEGIVYMGSPVGVRHAGPDAIVHAWLVTYASGHPEVETLANATVILDAENTVQPDALLRRRSEHSGLSRVTEEGYLLGPPELIVEVAASSASIDLRDKRRAYARNGVPEYVVWLVSEARLEWFCLEDEQYRAQTPDAQGMIESCGFPGLRLPVAALLTGDTAAVLAAVTR